MPSASLHITALSKRYGDFVALAPTDLEVVEGEFLTLLGPSGSGKTTLLSLIAGLSHPNAGAVRIGDKDITHSPPYARDIGMVFQNYALFPHMTVEENIAFPLKMRKVDGAEARRRVGEALEIVRLPHLAARFPRELSGGQQQRIALARCMVYRPSIILMDEPLGALDKKLREQMQLEIKRIHQELGATIVYVTHDQEEAMTMSDRICLMNGGQIEQLGTPDDLYFRPRSLFVADFLGESNLVPARVLGPVEGGLDVMIGSNQRMRAGGNGETFREGEDVTVMVRPQNLALAAADPGHGSAIMAGLADIVVSGSLTKFYLQPKIEGLPLLVAAFPTRSSAHRPATGDMLFAHWDLADAVVIRAETKASP